jgi:sec-independent protein translocase protein TatC
MSLRDHLRELRKRLVIAAGAIIVAAIGCWFLVPFVLHQLLIPVAAAAHVSHRDVSGNYQGVTSAFDVQIQLAITLGVVISSPIWLYQVWAFIVPGLKRRERRYVYGFLGAAIPLFLGGCTIGWIVFPHLVELLVSFAPAESASFISIDDYVGFVTKLIVAVGIAFVMPVVLVLLNFMSILSGKTILKGWRIAILLATVFAGIVTPTADVITMILLAVPIILLYFIAALIAHLHDRSAERRAEQFGAEIAV